VISVWDFWRCYTKHVSHLKTFTPFLIPTTAMLLLALTSCQEDNNRQAGEKANERPNQALDQRANQPDTPSGRAENNPTQGQDRTYQGDTQRQMGTTTGGTSAGGTTGGTSGGTGGTGGTAGTSTGGTSTGGTSTGGTAGTSTGGSTTTDKTTD
jgi:hypothetical protein